MSSSNDDIHTMETKAMAMASACVYCCASCGAAQNNDSEKLKQCPDCDLVHYCNDSCRKDHEAEHEAACKERAAELRLRDELLFKQPESSHFGDCPICFLPHPLIDTGYIHNCCGKKICGGCKCELVYRIGTWSCPFCRTTPSSDEMPMDFTNRAALNDANALMMVAVQYNVHDDFDKAFEFGSRAAKLGNAHSHFLLAKLYAHGEGVEKDRAMEIFHLEEAAIAGHDKARHKLGAYEHNERKNFARAVSHFMIGAKLGCDESIKALRICYKNGNVSKDDFATALRAQQAAVDATKSP